jgi:hypothetical protein
VTDKDEDTLKTLKKLGVRLATFGVHGIETVEFFPSADELEKKTKAEEEADTKVNPSTGLTRQQTQDILCTDE